MTTALEQSSSHPNLMVFVLLRQSVILEEDFDLGCHLRSNILTRKGQRDPDHTKREGRQRCIPNSRTTVSSFEFVRDQKKGGKRT